MNPHVKILFALIFKRKPLYSAQTYARRNIMATSSLKKSFVISSKSEASKLVKMFTDSLSNPIITKPVNVSNASPELLKEIINGGRK